MSQTSPRVGRLFASRPSLSPAAIGVAALLGAPIAPAQAEVITLRFEATVQFSSIVGTAFAGTVVGDTIFQDLTYDTSAAPFAVFPPPPFTSTEAHYQPIHALTSAGRNGQLLVSGAIEPGSLPNFETYIAINDFSSTAQDDEFRAITYFSALRFYIQLPVPNQAFSSLALPNFAPPLLPAPTTVLVITGASTDEFAYGVLTRVTLIPAPGCSLLATALLTATLRRRRRPPSSAAAGVRPLGTVGQVC